MHEGLYQQPAGFGLIGEKEIDEIGVERERKAADTRKEKKRPKVGSIADNDERKQAVTGKNADGAKQQVVGRCGDALGFLIGKLVLNVKCRIGLVFVDVVYTEQ